MNLVLAAATAVALSSLPLSAATLTVTNVVGSWTGLSGPATQVGGLNTNSVSWGDPYFQPDGPQSGYVFDGIASAGNVEDRAFAIGTFTHNNRTIFAGTSITGATLRVAFTFFLDVAPDDLITRIAEFKFGHDETPNLASPCADGGPNDDGVNVNGCADEVTVRTNPRYSETFDIDGLTYIFDVTGFDSGRNFWTTEEASNRSRMIGRFTVETNVAPIPLPATGGLLLAALAFGAAMSRRRSVT